MDPRTSSATLAPRHGGSGENMHGNTPAGSVTGSEAPVAGGGVGTDGTRLARPRQSVRRDGTVRRNAGSIRHQPRRHTVCMVCDFFFPRLGGVEMHIWSQAQCLMAMGHKVIVVTNAHGSRRGVRWMTNGLKVYYIPLLPFVDGSSLPTLGLVYFPLFRRILIREGVNIVHSHQATSTMAHECILMARTMGCRAIYTDHSLFGFADAASIHVNKMLKFTLSDISHAIAVSHTCRENLVLRASLDPSTVSAIPNAVDTTKFTPDPSARHPVGTINIVMINRLVYRKGVDLAVEVVPRLCDLFPNVHFIIGGDGSKKLLLEEMRERCQLHDRVELLGAVPHSQVPHVLRRGHIFLNCSLTEAFCIAIVEAASCGLFVVSTSVGGVPEVLRPDMIELAEPDVNDLIRALQVAIARVPTVDSTCVLLVVAAMASLCVRAFHDAVSDMYSWNDVAERTSVVYDRVMRMPNPPLFERLQRYHSAGYFFGLMCVAVASVLHMVFALLEWWTPADTIELAPDFPRHTYVPLRDALRAKYQPILPNDEPCAAPKRLRPPLARGVQKQY